jgi:hypothetical protein
VTVVLIEGEVLFIGRAFEHFSICMFETNLLTGTLGVPDEDFFAPSRAFRNPKKQISGEGIGRVR